MITPEAAAQKWAQRMGSASQNYKDGVMRVQTSPMEAAARNKTAWLAGINDAANNGRWEAGLQRVSLQQWQSSAANLGAQRIGPGATNAQPKVTSFMQSFWPTLTAAQAQVKSMPNDSYEARKARAIAMMDALHQFKRGR